MKQIRTNVRSLSLKGKSELTADYFEGGVYPFSKKNLDVKTQTFYFLIIMNALINNPVIFTNPNAVLAGDAFAHTAQHHTHHTTSATFCTMRSAVDMS
ncbi:MAG: hypothetical protein OXH16_16020 [Gemmatimonadetes bacterium]|nr:hypothetical protein [Gemmatimonadota bacterium]